MTTLWLLVLTIGFGVQGWWIRHLDQNVEAIKSWYPFCQILKIKIPEKDDFDFGGDKDD